MFAIFKSGIKLSILKNEKLYRIEYAGNDVGPRAAVTFHGDFGEDARQVYVDALSDSLEAWTSFKEWECDHYDLPDPIGEYERVRRLHNLFVSIFGSHEGIRIELDEQMKELEKTT